MDLFLDAKIGMAYTSNSQRIRVMSETWVAENMFCPCCGNLHITKLANNSPVADIQCFECGEIFELKTKKGKTGHKITDGAYVIMLERITSDTNPDLFVMNYDSSYYITDFTLIPKFFFVPKFIEKRKPLSSTARRAGWTGCNIIYSDIPKQGKIEIIQEGHVASVDEVVKQYNKVKQLQKDSLTSRGWLLDVLNCVNNINTMEFTLLDMYQYIDFLQRRHPTNNNVEAKIRQQLQFLRNQGFIEFIGRGRYKKI